MHRAGDAQAGFQPKVYGAASVSLNYGRVCQPYYGVWIDDSGYALTSLGVQVGPGEHKSFPQPQGWQRIGQELVQVQEDAAQAEEVMRAFQTVDASVTTVSGWSTPSARALPSVLSVFADNVPLALPGGLLTSLALAPSDNGIMFATASQPGDDMKVYLVRSDVSLGGTWQVVSQLTDEGNVNQAPCFAKDDYTAVASCASGNATNYYFYKLNEARTSHAVASPIVSPSSTVCCALLGDSTYVLVFSTNTDLLVYKWADTTGTPSVTTEAYPSLSVDGGTVLDPTEAFMCVYRSNDLISVYALHDMSVSNHRCEGLTGDFRGISTPNNSKAANSLLQVWTSDGLFVTNVNYESSSEDLFVFTNPAVWYLRPTKTLKYMTTRNSGSTEFIVQYGDTYVNIVVDMERGVAVMNHIPLLGSTTATTLAVSSYKCMGALVTSDGERAAFLGQGSTLHRAVHFVRREPSPARLMPKRERWQGAPDQPIAVLAAFDLSAQNLYHSVTFKGQHLAATPATGWDLDTSTMTYVRTSSTSNLPNNAVVATDTTEVTVEITSGWYETSAGQQVIGVASCYAQPEVIVYSTAAGLTSYEYVTGKRSKISNLTLSNLLSLDVVTTIGRDVADSNRWKLVTTEDAVDLPDALQNDTSLSMQPIGLVQILATKQNTGEVLTMVQDNDNNLLVLPVCHTEEATTNTTLLHGQLMICNVTLTKLFNKSIVPILNQSVDTNDLTGLQGTPIPHLVTYLDRVFALTSTHIMFLEGHTWVPHTTWPGEQHQVTGLSATLGGLVINTTQGLFRLADDGTPEPLTTFGHTDNLLGNAFGTAVAGQDKVAVLVEDRLTTASTRLVRTTPAPPRTNDHDEDRHDAGIALLAFGALLMVAAIVVVLVPHLRHMRTFYALAGLAILLLAVGGGLLGST